MRAVTRKRHAREAWETHPAVKKRRIERQIQIPEAGIRTHHLSRTSNNRGIPELRHNNTTDYYHCNNFIGWLCRESTLTSGERLDFLAGQVPRWLALQALQTSHAGVDKRNTVARNHISIGAMDLQLLFETHQSSPEILRQFVDLLRPLIREPQQWLDVRRWSGFGSGSGSRSGCGSGQSSVYFFLPIVPLSSRNVQDSGDSKDRNDYLARQDDHRKHDIPKLLDQALGLQFPRECIQVIVHCWLPVLP